MKVINNITETLRDDLANTLKKGSKLSIAAACFSMYAYRELKKQLEGIDEMRFIFTSPTFTTEKASKERREFYIPRLTRETSLYGTEFEIKLRNEMTQKAIARECADWIRRKATFQSNTSGENMPGFMTIQNGQEDVAYQPISGFTTVELGCDRGNNAYNVITRMEAPFTSEFIRIFDSVWNDASRMQNVTDEIIENITSVYQENAPEFIYFVTLYHVFSEFLDDVSEDVLPNEATGFKQSKIWNMLYDFQKDAALAIINKLEKYNGCILADSVGLGKTFTALAVVKYYENRNKTVLVLCPKKLAENWNTYKDNYVNNPIASDRLNYDKMNSCEPILGKGRDGRNNVAGLSYLYAASNEETACAEIKSQLGELISLAEFEVKKRLNIIDFSCDKTFEREKSKLHEMSFGVFFTQLMMKYCEPVNDSSEYKVTQLISEYIRKTGVDGIAYKSYLSPGGINYTIFHSHRSLIEYQRSRILIHKQANHSFWDFNNDKAIFSNKDDFQMEYDKKIAEEHKKHLKMYFKIKKGNS